MLFYFGKFSTLKKQGILILLLWKISNNIFRFNILNQLSVVYWYFDSTLQLVCTINFNDVLFILKKLLFPPETFCLRAIMKHTHTCGNQDITSRFAFRINRSSFVVSFHHPVTLWRSIVSQHQTIFQRSRTFWECACPRPALSSIPSIWRKFGLGRVWRTSKAFRIFELLWSLLVTSVLSVVSCVFFPFILCVSFLTFACALKIRAVGWVVFVFK